MPVRFLSDPELARLSSWPDEIAEHDLVTFFTLTSDDSRWLAGFNVRVENRLGAAVQLCTLPWLGWIPDDLTGCPAAALDRLADALASRPMTCPSLLAAYGGWEGRTRRDHRALVLTRLGWRVCAAGERKQLDAFLLARALEHDAPGVLLQLACDWLRHERIMRPSVDTLSRRVAAARDGARAETYHRLAPLLDSPRRASLDALLDVDDELGMTRLAWLRRGATAATPGGRQGGAGQAGVPAPTRRRSTGSVGVADRSAADAGQDRPPLHQPGVATRRCRPSTPDPAGDAGRDLRRGPRRAGTAARPSTGRRGLPRPPRALNQRLVERAKRRDRPGSSAR